MPQTPRQRSARPPTGPDAGATGRQPGLGPAGIALGVGLGGFVDGILLHQVLQWHHMLTSTDSDHIGVPFFPRDTVAGLEMNTLWDGLFHAFTWVMVLVGLALLFARTRTVHRRAWAHRVLWGWVLAGWGVFNLVEGLLNHHLLGIHHVRAGEHQLAYDLGFLALGAVLLVGGTLLARSATRTDTDPG